LEEKKKQEQQQEKQGLAEMRARQKEECVNERERYDKAKKLAKEWIRAQWDSGLHLCLDPAVAAVNAQRMKKYRPDVPEPYKHTDICVWCDWLCRIEETRESVKALMQYTRERQLLEREHKADRERWVAESRFLKKVERDMDNGAKDVGRRGLPSMQEVANQVGRRLGFARADTYPLISGCPKGIRTVTPVLPGQGRRFTLDG
jgi:hypothetical protein